MPATTQEVLDHHLMAFDAGDVDMILSDYAPDAVMMTPEGAVRGHEQIRPVLQRLLDDVFGCCTSFEMIRQVVEGEVAYIAWTAVSHKFEVPLATDTYIIKGGKIVVQTFSGHFRPAAPRSCCR
jgi:hypothetical protein